MHSSLAPKRGRRESRVRAAPAVSCARCTKECAHEHTGSAEAIRPSLRNGFTAYFRALPGDRACLSPSPREIQQSPRPVGLTCLSRDLTPASRRQNHTTSPSASASFVSVLCDRSRETRPAIPSAPDAAASTASRPNVRDDGQRPSEGWDGGSYEVDLGEMRSGIFLRMGLDSFW
jgi:hypothetical protein